MTEQVENLILEHLRVMRGDISIIKQDVGDLKFRMGSVESHLTNLHGDVVHLNSRFDDLGARVSRIEQRLELQS